LLIFNQLRFPFLSLHLLASCILFHTARRSFATHLQRSKVPLSSISMALGHKKVTTTMRYLRLGVDENAAILAGSSFFKDFEEDE
jgi:integrase